MPIILLCFLTMNINAIPNRYFMLIGQSLACVTPLSHLTAKVLCNLGYAKSLKLRYANMQQQKTDYVEHRPSGVGSKVSGLCKNR